MNNLLDWFNPTRWAILFGVLLALVAALGTTGWKLYDNGKQAGQAALRAQWLGFENDALREQARETARLTGIVNNLEEANRETLNTLDAAERRLADADAQRLRALKAGRDAAIATATAETLRGYATTAADLYGACRTEYRALGFSAARCSAAAHTLNSYADTVSGSTTQLPTPPTPPSLPSSPTQP